MTSIAAQTVKACLEAEDAPQTVEWITSHTGVARSTVYTALKELSAVRVRIKKQQYAYSLPEARTLEFPSVQETPGRINGKSWVHAAKNVVQAVNSAPISKRLTPNDYAEGFTAIGQRFLELAAHAEYMQDKTDWQIQMGFVTDTEKS